MLGLGPRDWILKWNPEVWFQTVWSGHKAYTNSALAELSSPLSMEEVDGKMEKKKERKKKKRKEKNQLGLIRKRFSTSGTNCDSQRGRGARVPR